MNSDRIRPRHMWGVFCLLLLGAVDVRAGDPCARLIRDGVVSVESMVKHVRHMKAGDLNFEKQLRNSYAEIKKLEVSYKAVTKVGPRLGDGAFASLVVRVNTDQGVKALKIYEYSSLRRVAATLVIQNALAKINRAPAITGYLSSKEIAKLIKEHPQIHAMLRGRSAKIGVLMDYVEGGQNPYVSGLGTTTPYAEAQILEIESEMSRLRILPALDLQFVIDRSGRMILIDFDGYDAVDSGGTVYGLGHEKRAIEDFLFESEYEERFGFGLDNLDWFYIDESGNYFARLSRTRGKFGLRP